MDVGSCRVAGFRCVKEPGFLVFVLLSHPEDSNCLSFFILVTLLPVWREGRPEYWCHNFCGSSSSNEDLAQSPRQSSWTTGKVWSSTFQGWHSAEEGTGGKFPHPHCTQWLSIILLYSWKSNPVVVAVAEPASCLSHWYFTLNPCNKPGSIFTYLCEVILAASQEKFRWLSILRRAGLESLWMSHTFPLSQWFTVSVTWAT